MLGERLRVQLVGYSWTGTVNLQQFPSKLSNFVEDIMTLRNTKLRAGITSSAWPEMSLGGPYCWPSSSSAVVIINGSSTLDTGSLWRTLVRDPRNVDESGRCEVTKYADEPSGRPYILRARSNTAHGHRST